MTLISRRQRYGNSVPTDWQASPHVPPLARRPVLIIAGAVALLLISISNRFGFSNDELYFLVAGRHLDWGYPDQPPLVPVLTHVMDVLFGGSLVALRTPPALMAAGSVVVAALTSRELGGRRGAQILTATTCALAPITLQSGHALITTPVDTFLAGVSCWLLVRWIRLRDDRLLLVLGAVVAIELQVKYLAVTFWGALFAAALVFGPRELLRRPKLWIGTLLVVAVTTPSLIWQAQHGWPQIAVSKAVADEVARAGQGGVHMLSTLFSCGVSSGCCCCLTDWFGCSDHHVSARTDSSAGPSSSLSLCTRSPAAGVTTPALISCSPGPQLWSISRTDQNS